MLLKGDYHLSIELGRGDSHLLVNMTKRTTKQDKTGLYTRTCDQ